MEERDKCGDSGLGAGIPIHCRQLENAYRAYFRGYGQFGEGTIRAILLPVWKRNVAKNVHPALMVGEHIHSVLLRHCVRIRSGCRAYLFP